MRLLFVDELDAHLRGAAAQGGALASGDDAGAKAGGARQGQALAVVGVEGFDFERGAVGWESSVTLPLVMVPSTSISRTLICLARLATAAGFWLGTLATVVSLVWRNLKYLP